MSARFGKACFLTADLGDGIAACVDFVCDGAQQLGTYGRATTTQNLQMPLLLLRRQHQPAKAFRFEKRALLHERETK